MSFKRRDRFFAVVVVLWLASVAVAGLIDYKGRSVIETPTGAGGIALKNNEVVNADRVGTFETQSGSPDVNDDLNSDPAAWPNSVWKDTDNNQLYWCVSNSDGAAAWIRLITETAAGIVAPIQLDGALPMLHIGPTATISINPTVVVAEAHTGNANFRGIVIESTMTPTTGGHAYAAYDVKASLNGNQDFGHINAFQSNLRMEGSGTVDRMAAVRSVNVVNSGTVTELRHIDIVDFTGAGTVTTQYGIYIPAGFDNAGTNWAIYSDDSDAKSYLAGFLGVGHTNPSERVDTGGGDFTANNGQWYKMKVTGGADNGILQIDGSDNTIVNAQNGQEIRFSIGATDYKMTLLDSGAVGIGTATPSANADLTLEGGVLNIKETTTPSADANYGKVYTKNDNKLYFQDGAGNEHEISIVGHSH